MLCEGGWGVVPYSWARSSWTQGHCRCTSRDVRSSTPAAAFLLCARVLFLRQTGLPDVGKSVCAVALTAHCECKHGPAMCLLHGPCRCCRPLLALVGWVFFPWICISEALPSQWRRQCRQSLRSTAAQY